MKKQMGQKAFSKEKKLEKANVVKAFSFKEKKLEKANVVKSLLLEEKVSTSIFARLTDEVEKNN